MFLSSYSFSTLALIACLALLLNFLLGASARSLAASLAFLHPLALWEKLLLKASEKLNRFRRSTESRRRRGVLLALVAIVLAVLLGDILRDVFLLPGGEILEIALLALLLGAGQQIGWSLQIEKLLRHSPGAVNRELLPIRLVRRQQHEYDNATVIRGGIEAMMLALSEGVAAPLFYYLLAGWPGLLATLAITAMDALLGYRNSQYQDFGAAAARLHTLLQYLPARITGALICVASLFAPACAPLAAWRIMFAHAGRMASANAGWPVAATAGALQITLGGPRAMFGSYIADQWIGEGKVQVTLKAIKAARWLYAISVLLMIMGLLFIAAA